MCVGGIDPLISGVDLGILRGGGGGGSGPEFFGGGGVQVRRTFHILTSKKKRNLGGGGKPPNPPPLDPPLHISVFICKCTYVSIPLIQNTLYSKVYKYVSFFTALYFFPPDGSDNRYRIQITARILDRIHQYIPSIYPFPVDNVSICKEDLGETEDK